MFTDIIQNRFFQIAAAITVVTLCLFGYNYNNSDSEAGEEVVTIKQPKVATEKVSTKTTTKTDDDTENTVDEDNSNTTEENTVEKETAN